MERDEKNFKTKRSMADIEPGLLPLDSDEMNYLEEPLIKGAGDANLSPETGKPLI